MSFLWRAASTAARLASFGVRVSRITPSRDRRRARLPRALAAPCALATCAVLGACADRPAAFQVGSSQMLAEGVPDRAPASFSATCSRQPELYASPARLPASNAFSPSSPVAPHFDDASALRLVQKVNGDVNGAMARIGLLINAADDGAPALRTPGGLVGDCKSFAAEKRRRLIAAGFPSERLFYAVVFRENIGLHALLMVRLDLGDYAMDSRGPLVMPWREVDYLYVERQAADDPYRWINLVAPRRAVAGLQTAANDIDVSRAVSPSRSIDHR